MGNKTQNIPIKRDEAGHSGHAWATHPIMGLRTEIDHMFDRFLGSWPNLWRGRGRGRDLDLDFDPFRSWGENWMLSPSVDVSETEQDYEIAAELPGLNTKDIELTLNDNVLTLKGEKKEEREEKNKNYRLSERSYGSFQRSFTLPADVDAEKINTAFSKGVLTITLPKSEQAKAKTRKIEVKGA